MRKLLFILAFCTFAPAQWTSSGWNSTGQFNISGTPQFTITTPSLPSANAGATYGPITLQTANGTTPISCVTNPSGMPPGIGLSSSCVVSGSSSTVGLYAFTATANDSASHTATKPFTISITCPPLQITSPGTLTPQATQNVPWVGFQMQAQGGLGTLTWTNPTGTFPTGITINSSGFISGTPTNTGTFTPIVAVTDSCPTPQKVSQQESLTVVANSGPLQLTNTTPFPAATVGQLYTVPLTANGGTPPYTFSQPPGNWLPPGLSLTATSITGTPTGNGTFSGTLTVTDNVGATNNGASPYTIVVNAASNADNRYCNSSNQWIGPATMGPSTAPTSCYNTALANTPATGSTVTAPVASCLSLQTLITNATAGQIIQLPPLNSGNQNVYSGCNLTISAAGTASNYIYLETSAQVSISGEGSRLTPAWAGVTSMTGRPAYAQPAVAGIYVPKIVGNTASSPVLHFTSTAAYWRIIGINLASTAATNGAAIVILDAGANHIIGDRLWINGADTDQSSTSTQAGWRVNSSPYVALIDSYVSNIACVNGGTCGDAQGIFMGGSAAGTDGPQKYVDNFVEAGSEPIFSGGGGVGASTVPATDSEIRRNHIFKPLYWKENDPSYLGVNFNVKNSLELKNSQRTWIEGNIFDTDWEGQSDQHGISVLFDSRNQNSSYTGVATVSGNTLTWTSGSQFQSSSYSSGCPGGLGTCIITVGTAHCTVASFISATQITVNCPGGGVIINNSWSQITNPSGGNGPIGIAFNPTTNAYYLATWDGGFFVSYNQGATWSTAQNSGLPTLGTNVHVGTVNWDTGHTQVVVGVDNFNSGGRVSWFRATDPGSGNSWSWTNIPISSTVFQNTQSSYGSTTYSNGTLALGMVFGNNGSMGYAYSTNGGTSTNTITVGANSSWTRVVSPFDACPAPGASYSRYPDPATGYIWGGTEQCGPYRSTDNGVTFSPCGPADNNFQNGGNAGPRVGNLIGITTNSSGQLLFSAQGGIFRQSSTGTTCPYTFGSGTPSAPVFVNGNTSNGKGLITASNGWIFWIHTADTSNNGGRCTTGAGKCFVYYSTDGGTTWGPFDTNLPTSVTGTLYDGEQIIQNSTDGQLYAVFSNSSNANSGSLWHTTGSNNLPPQGSQSFSAAIPGLNPNAVLIDTIFINNYITHAANGLQIANPPSDNGDLSLTNKDFDVENNVADDIDGARWQTGTDCCNYGSATQIQNQEGGSAALDQITLNHNTFLPTYSTGTNTSVAAAFSFSNQTVTGSQIGHLTVTNNISAGGWAPLGNTSSAQSLITSFTPSAQLCWDHNLTTVSTLPGGGTGTFTRNNPPYPAAGNSLNCSFTAAGSTSTTDYSTVLFTTLNSANGGTYSLQSGSPGHNAASDGSDLGVNWTTFQNAIAGVQ